MLMTLSHSREIYQFMKRNAGIFLLKKQLLLIENTNHLICAILAIFSLIIIIKSYYINIVWRCYKFLKLDKDLDDMTDLPDKQCSDPLASPPSYEDVVEKKEEYNNDSFELHEINLVGDDCPPYNEAMSSASTEICNK